jgi:hypothetical protein
LKPNNPVNYKLPFLRVIAAAVYFAWSNKAELLKAISVPTLALVIVWGVWLTFSAELPYYFSWIFLLGYGLGFSFLAVTSHRLILAGDVDRYKSFNAKPGYRELRFLGWMIAIYAIKSLLEFVILIPFHFVNAGSVVDDGGKVADWVKQIASIPAIYVLARLSLAFPATAIDKSCSLRWSWIRTRGNGWRIFVVVGLFPWLTGMAIESMSREEATVLELVALSILTYIGLAVEIIALSFTYKELAKHYEPVGQTISDETPPMLADAPQDSFHELGKDEQGGKAFAVLMAALVFVIGILLIGPLTTFVADCTGELISTATSPNGAYKAQLLSRTCKDESREQGLVLDIVRSTTPKTINSYSLSRTVSNDVELAWTSGRDLVVRHAGSLDSADMPRMIDDIQIVFEKKPIGPASQ